MSRLGQFRIEGVLYDLDDLTLNEMRDIEDMVDGTPFSDLNFGSSKAMIAASFVLQRRRNPAITVEQAGEVKLLEMLAPDEEMPPLPPATGDENQNASTPDGSGRLPSPASTTG